jgi:hypothetical protein
MQRHKNCPLRTYVPEDIERRVQIVAALEHRSVSDLLRHLILMYLNGCDPQPQTSIHDLNEKSRAG